MTCAADLAAPQGYEPGTWLRFMSGGRLVIGAVQYRDAIEGYSSAGRFRYTTDVGVVSSRDVLEAR